MTDDALSNDQTLLRVYPREPDDPAVNPWDCESFVVSCHL